jgi:hypothetical protein
MSRYFPHSDYAEDQPYAKTILTAHVLDRGFQTGTILGLLTGSIRSLIRKQPLAKGILLPTGYGALIGTASMVPALALRMYGREDIEWKDRSWRLLENEGQMEVDDWSSVGFVGGAVATARSEAFRVASKGRWVRFVGGAALGECVGIMGYLVWRYGVHGGKWPSKL